MSKEAAFESKELDEMVGAAPVSMRLFPDKNGKTFRTFHSLYAYMLNEKTTWESLRKFSAAETLFNSFKKIISEFDAAIAATDESNRTARYNSAIQLIYKSQANITVARVYSESRAGRRLIDLCLEQRSNEYVYSFFDYIVTGSARQIANSNKDYFLGIMDAYLTLNPINRSKEIKAKEEELATLVERIEVDADELYNKHAAHWKTVDNEHKKHLAETEKWKKETEKNLEDYLNEKRENIQKLEETYKEKLRLEAPVEYWEKAKNANHKNGVIWIVIATLASLVTAIYVYCILTNLPYDLQGDISSFNVNSIRNTLLITAGVSVLIYLIRIFIKFAISSFHLSKDAAERVTLTYLFLALTNDSKEGNVSESERAIVLQALFSRADTGLLKGDASPSYSPDSGLVSAIVKNMGAKTS